jgi:hypothetical protein
MADQKRDRGMQPREGGEKLSHHDKKQRRKEMMEKMKGAAQERPSGQPGSGPGKKLPLPE